MKKSIIYFIIVSAVAAAFFTGCSKKQEIKAEEPSEEFVLSEEDAIPENSSSMAFVYETTKGGTGVLIQKYVGTASNVVIPDTIEGLPVVKIQYDAFRNNMDIESVVIPASVKEIEYNAFRGSSIKKVVLQEGLQTIGSGAFRETELKSVEIPEGVSFIGGYQFYACHDLTSAVIPSSLKIIPEGFMQESALTSIVFPEGVEEVMGNAFYECNISSLTIPSTMRKLNVLAFAHNPLAQVETADSLHSLSIASNCFFNCNEKGTMTIELRQKLNKLGYKGIYHDKDITSCR